MLITNICQDQNETTIKEINNDQVKRVYIQVKLVSTAPDFHGPELTYTTD